MTSLASRAQELLAQAKQLDRILEQNNIPYPSFDNDALEQLPEDAQRLRWNLLDNSHNLRQLVRGARLSGLDIAFSVCSFLKSFVIACLMRNSGRNNSSYASYGDTN
jgi:hypothetical protein